LIKGAKTNTRQRLVISNASMANNLSQISLIKMLQKLNFNKKTKTLSINTTSRPKQVVLSRGRVRSASFGDEKGVEAVRSMVKLKEGTFVVTSSGEPIEAELDIS